jgi:hypothetical protein
MGNIKRRRPQNKQPDDAVGYGSPPRHSRWKTGQSGNPKGRPKGSRNFKTDVQLTLQAPVQITRSGKAQKVSTQSAVLLRLRENALKGDGRAIDKVIELARSHNSEEFTGSTSLTVEDENILQIYRERVLRGAVSASSKLKKTTGKSGNEREQP